MLTIHTVALLCPGHLRSIPIMSTNGGIAIFSFLRLCLIMSINGGIAIFSFLRLCLICHHRPRRSWSITQYALLSVVSSNPCQFPYTGSNQPLSLSSSSRFLLRMSRRMLLFTHGDLPFCLTFLIGMCFFVSLFSTRRVAKIPYFNIL